MLNVSAVVARLWLFDIVKRVLTYSLRRGAGVYLREQRHDPRLGWGEAG